MQPRRRCRPLTRNNAFTLVELLVVIGIIAVLIGILMPALARARAHAVSVQCMSNLRQIGQICFQYATENKGWLPTSQPDSIRNITAGGNIAGNADAGLNPAPSNKIRQDLNRRLKNSTGIFYCPANMIDSSKQFLDGDVANSNIEAFQAPAALLEPGDTGFVGACIIGYWYVGDPWRPGGAGGANPAPAAGAPAADVIAGRYGYRQWIDTNGNNNVTDEYFSRLGQKGSAEIVIATDKSRQQGGGWLFLHGKLGQAVANSTDTSKVKTAWKNNLYGDGHVEPKRPDEVKPRWSLANPAIW